MRDFESRFESFVESHALLPLDQRIVVAISGGLDSMVLAVLLAKRQLDLSLVHVNYGLRGPASDEDEAFIRQYAAKTNLALHVLDARNMISDSRPSIQNQARSIRYDYFAAVAKEIGARIVAVAHHADDLAETVLLNALRATNTTGLSPMPVSRILAGSNATLVRPLRFARRSEIANYAREVGIEWREDASNADEKYSRSRLRHDVLPHLEQSLGFDPTETLTTVANLFGEHVTSERQARLAELRKMTLAGSPGSFKVEEILELSVEDQNLLILDVLQSMSAGEYPVTRHQVRRIADLLTSQAGKIAPMFGGRFIRTQTRIEFEGEKATPITNEIQLIAGSQVEWAGSVVSVREVTSWSKEEATQDSVFIDADTVSWPLRIRKWEPGDRFTPIGFPCGSKKISDLLTDMKADSAKKKSVPVLISGDDIVWVAGFRQSHKSRITDKTSRIVELSYRAKKPVPVRLK